MISVAHLKIFPLYCQLISYELGYKKELGLYTFQTAFWLQSCPLGTWKVASASLQQRFQNLFKDRCRKGRKEILFKLWLRLIFWFCIDSGYLLSFKNWMKWSAPHTDSLSYYCFSVENVWENIYRMHARNPSDLFFCIKAQNNSGAIIWPSGTDALCMAASFAHLFTRGAKHEEKIVHSRPTDLFSTSKTREESKYHSFWEALVSTILLF